MTPSLTVCSHPVRTGPAIAFDSETVTEKPINFSSIRALRGISALFVTLFHLVHVAETAAPSTFLVDVFEYGFGGVDIFFVISGFVITHSCWHKMARPDQWRPFISARLLRIYPIYWVFLSIFTSLLLLAYFFYPSLKWVSYPFDWGTALRTLFLAPQHVQIITVTWTLSFELYFYLLFSFLILSKRLLIIPVLVLMGTLYTGIALALNQPCYSKYVFGDFTDFFFSGFTIEFFSGILIYLIYKKTQFSVPIVLLPIAVTAWIIAGSYVLPADVWPRVLSVGLASFVIVLSLVLLEKNRRFYSPTWLLKLGDASFVLYLIHIPVLMVLKQTLIRFDLASWVELSCLLAGLSLGWVSYLLHRRIEKPLLKLLK